MIITFSLQMGNVKRLHELTERYGWKDTIFVERLADEQNNLPHLCLLKLTPTQ